YERRLYLQAAADWRAASEAERRSWREAARRANKAERMKPDPLHEYVRICRDHVDQSDEAAWPWGLGSDEFPLSEDLVSAAVQAHVDAKLKRGSFVEATAVSFDEMYNAAVAPPGLIRCGLPTERPCCTRAAECLGGVADLRGEYQGVVEDLRLLVAPARCKTVGKMMTLQVSGPGGCVMIRNFSHLKSHIFTGEFCECDVVGQPCGLGAAPPEVPFSLRRCWVERKGRRVLKMMTEIDVALHILRVCGRDRAELRWERDLHEARLHEKDVDLATGWFQAFADSRPGGASADGGGSGARGGDEEPDYAKDWKAAWEAAAAWRQRGRGAQGAAEGAPAEAPPAAAPDAALAHGPLGGYAAAAAPPPPPAGAPRRPRVARYPQLPHPAGAGRPHYIRLVENEALAVYDMRAVCGLHPGCSWNQQSRVRPLAALWWWLGEAPGCGSKADHKQKVPTPAQIAAARAVLEGMPESQPWRDSEERRASGG
ncbi:unnamed protein product, partial [Prorocentrum cordatum]